MRWIGCLTLAGLIALSGGCATSSEDRAAAMTTYRLQLPADAALPTFPTRRAVLAVAAPDAPGALRGREIAYQPEQNQLRYYSRNFWADPPVRMLEVALVSAFDRSRLFQGVVRDPGSVRADYRLSTDLLRLEQDFQSDGSSQLDLAMRVQLIDLGERTLLGSRLIEVRVPAPTADAKGAVQAAHAALAQALTEAVEFAAAALPADGK